MSSKNILPKKVNQTSFFMPLERNFSHWLTLFGHSWVHIKSFFRWTKHDKVIMYKDDIFVYTYTISQLLKLEKNVIALYKEYFSVW